MKMFRRHKNIKSQIYYLLVYDGNIIHALQVGVFIKPPHLVFTSSFGKKLDNVYI